MQTMRLSRLCEVADFTAIMGTEVVPGTESRRARRAARRRFMTAYGVDLVITAASVIPGTGAQVATAVAGVALTGGQVIYIDSGGLAQLSDNNNGAIKHAAAGIVLPASVAAGQTFAYQKIGAGLITIGATVAKGSIYVLSSTPGGIAPVADYGAAMYMTIVGVGFSTTQIDMSWGGATGYLSA